MSTWTRLFRLGQGRGNWSIAPPRPFRSTAWTVFSVLGWVSIVNWVHLYVIELTLIDGSSMYPFFNEDKNSTLLRDAAISWKWAPQENLERGMVVTLRSPMNPEDIAVKRVVALEGDVIKTKAPHPASTVQVPPNHVWVEGDGPPGSSLDSNNYGPVSKRLLTGKVTFVVFPFRKFGLIKYWEYQRPLVKGARNFSRS